MANKILAKASAPSADDASAGLRRYVLFALFVIYTWNFVDRIIVGVVQEALKREFALTDFQLGLLGGPAFSFLYVLIGFPFAWAADRYNRTSILAGALAAWSVFTAACGFAGSFLHLLMFRAGVGIGEAGCSPTSHSLIADYFPPHKRSFAFAVFASGVSVGSIIAGFFGGALVGHYGWRGAFWVLGGTGVVLALIFKATVREPSRGGAQEATPAFFTTARFLLSQPVYRQIMGGNSTAALIGYSYTAYLTSFFARTYQMPIPQAAMHIAFVNGVAGACGTFLGGYLADRLTAKMPRARAVVPLVGFLVALPLMILGFMSSNSTVATVLLMAGTAAQLMYFGPSFSLVHAIAEPRMRATAAAILLFAVNLLGLTLGPPLLGLVSDAFNQALVHQNGLGWCAQSWLAQTCGRPEAGGLRLGMALFAILNLWPAFHFWRVSRHLAKQARAAQ